MEAFASELPLEVWVGLELLVNMLQEILHAPQGCNILLGLPPGSPPARKGCQVSLEAAESQLQQSQMPGIQQSQRSESGLPSLWISLGML